ncbi:E3 ubiquitin-protein ligase MARCH4 [Tolypocladium ophioglossoides CBS 100239]|uniref:E3 ubiquitin-protein ligase MARCH4 n=1 Tax=Tolypocladium ophioglossoides (strain CBS 100239) TaxID=1163406 RepID=A0A0L0NEM5_TOLOC|nr:E3 ubiquitin-protein ligase MARCH4 [Tolypocladium ophioglossoides CBS 100239]
MDTQPTWSWNPAIERDPAPSTSNNLGTESTGSQEPDHHTTEETRAPPRTNPTGRRYGPRTCRICLDTEQPKYPTGITSTFGISSASSRPTYDSDDPELGRLLSPCKCKGSQKYVHEGCLNSWRRANPMAARNYWQCPTCKFNYRLARLRCASMLSSKWAQVALTLVVVVIGIFLLGFIADPVLDLWFDPVRTISDTVTNVVSDVEAIKPSPYQEPDTWTEHFAKGFISLGFVGFIKSIIAMGPWQWLQVRTSLLFGSGGRRLGTGRARMNNFNLFFVAIGAFTFLMAIWNVVKAVSARVLRNVSDNVLDVGEDDDSGDGDDEAEGEWSGENRKDQ